MESALNEIKNSLLIKLMYVDFVYLEEDIRLSSPVDKYYFKSNDLSINLNINLKWSLYAYFFLYSIQDTIGDDAYTSGLNFNDSISKLYDRDFPKELYIDDFKVDSLEKFKELFETEYTDLIYTENSVVHFKLKVNIDEFIFLKINLFPQLFIG